MNERLIDALPYSPTISKSNHLRHTTQIKAHTTYHTYHPTTQMPMNPSLP